MNRIIVINHIAVIGANGSTGKEVVRLALQRGYSVTAIARNLDSILPSEKLTRVAGDVTEQHGLVESFANADAVISCFGPANGLKAGNLMSTGAKNIVTASEKANVQRLVFMSGILQTDGKELTVMNRLGIRLIRLFYKNIYEDKVIAERAVQKSPLKWVIVRASGLKEAAGRGIYTAGPGASISPFKPLSFSDCAACLLHAAEEPNWTRRIVNVGQ